MTLAPKGTRPPADKVHDTGGTVGSIEHEDYVSHPEKGAAAHQRVTWDDMTTEEAIEY